MTRIAFFLTCIVYSVTLMRAERSQATMKKPFEMKTDYSKIFEEKKNRKPASLNLPVNPEDYEIHDILAKASGNRKIGAKILGFSRNLVSIKPDLVIKTVGISTLVSTLIPFSLTGGLSTTAAAKIAEYTYHQNLGEEYRNPPSGMIDQQSFYKKTKMYVGTRKFKEPDSLEASLFFGRLFKPEIIEQDTLDGILAAFTSEDGNKTFYVLVTPEDDATYKTYEVFAKNLSPESLENSSKKFLGTYNIDTEDKSRVFEASSSSSAWGFTKTAFYTSIVGLMLVKYDELAHKTKK